MRLLRFLLIEARDWVFAIGAFVAVGWAATLESWSVRIPLLIGFVVLYLLAVFASSRLLRE